MEKAIVNEVIEELSRINSAAEEFAENTENAKIKLGRDYRDKKINYDEELNEAAKERLDALQAKLEAEIEEKKNALIKENEEYMSRLEKAFEEKHSEWAEDIMRQVVSERL